MAVKCKDKSRKSNMVRNPAGGLPRTSKNMRLLIKVPSRIEAKRPTRVPGCNRPRRVHEIGAIDVWALRVSVQKCEFGSALKKREERKLNDE
jgi:hypothetical protein